MLNQVGEDVKKNLLPMVGPGAFATWIDPLIVAFVKENGVAVLLAPSTEWDGIQDKFKEKITQSLAKNGLTNGFELWCMCGGDKRWKAIA